MVTLKELHNLRGSPDFSHWNTVKLFSIVEASLLTAGLEPCEYNHLADGEIRQKLLNEKPINWQHALMLVRSLTEAICTQEIKSPFIRIERCDFNSCWSDTVEQAKISLDDTGVIVANETKIHRDELSKWLKKYGYFESPQQNTITINTQSVLYQQSELVQNNEVLLLPEPTYTTPPLEAVQGVIREFWIDYDPNGNQRPPKQEVIKTWIEQNHPEIDSKYMREAIDKICRHPNARGGGNTKIN